MFCVTLEEQEPVKQIFFNALLIVVMNCFLGISFSQLYCFTYNEASLKSACTLVSS